MVRSLTKDDVISIAIRDAATRAGVNANEVTLEGAEMASFPNAALGAPREGEMSFDMVTNGWAVWLSAGRHNFEYRADGRQVRLYEFAGCNHMVYPA